MENDVAATMCSIMGLKLKGLEFDYLMDEYLKDRKIMDKWFLNDSQSYKLHRARCLYDGRLKELIVILV